MVITIEMVYAEHNNGLGNRCPHSGQPAPADAETDDPCPAGCWGSWVTEAGAAHEDNAILRWTWHLRSIGVVGEEVDVYGLLRRYRDE